VVAVRWALSGVFLFSTLLGLFTGNVVGFVIKFLPLTMSGLAVTILFGRFWKRVTWQGGLAALIVTPAVSVIGFFLKDNDTLATIILKKNGSLTAMAAGALALIVVSLMTPPRQRTIEEVAADMAKERQSIEGAVGHHGPAENPQTKSANLIQHS
jgi:SSS family solute:Na+ symporter